MMSTPERADDPGEYGYGGSNQDFPTEDGSGDTSPRAEDEDKRAHGNEPDGEQTRRPGWPQAD